MSGTETRVISLLDLADQHLISIRIIGLFISRMSFYLNKEFSLTSNSEKYFSNLSPSLYTPVSEPGAKGSLEQN